VSAITVLGGGAGVRGDKCRTFVKDTMAVSPIRSITGKGRREDTATGSLKLKSETLILGAE